MKHELLLGLVSILLFGVGAQWLAAQLRFPSIVLLLTTGIVAGPVLKWIHPDQLFGDTLFPLVSISVAIILFEGGLSLDFNELRRAGKPVIGLITVGVAVTAILAIQGAHTIFGWSWSLAALMGAILTVTGPTVVLPMLRLIRPSGQVGSILKWEGILNDPIGAVLAVLVFEAIHFGNYSNALSTLMKDFAATIGIGILFGCVGAAVVIVSIKRFWVPDALQNPWSLAIVLGTFVGANMVRAESGLLAVTVMGIALTNQRWAPVREMVAFKENLRVLLLSSLFILLAARIDLAKLQAVRLGVILFLIWLVAVVRPAAVWVSTLGSGLTVKEKCFLSVMAPRGIVAAAVTSVFSLELVRSGQPGADELEGVIYVVIVFLAVFYGILAPWLAKVYGIAQEQPQGVLFVGAHPLACAIAKTIKEEGFKVLMVDTNRENTTAARMAGLPTAYVSILSSSAEDDLDLEGLGYLAALTSNAEVNTLAGLRFRERFSRSHIFQLLPGPVPFRSRETVAVDFKSRPLFAANATFDYLVQRFDAGWVIKKTRLTPEFDFEKWRQQSEESVVMFLIDEKARLTVVTPEEKIRPAPGQLLISLTPPVSKLPANSSPNT